MPLPNRITPGGLPFHVLNRAVGRRTIFSTAADYECFIETVAETLRTRPMRICGYCVMPNHWHMVLWPEHDGDLSAFVQHLTNLHVKRWKRAHDEVGLAQVTHLGTIFQVFGSFTERTSLRDKARSRETPCSEDLGLEFSLVKS